MIAPMIDATACTAPNMVVCLESHVRRRLSSRLRSFRVQVRDAGLILEGCVTTYYAKQLVQHAVMEATALPILANEIEVR